jgi:hypothetical protein
MPCTALIITKEDGTTVRIKFLTMWNPPFTDIDLFTCNEEFEPIGNPGVTQVEIDEESYHKNLRIEASAKEQYVSSESTDPQWNPGYVESPEELEDGNQNSL